MDSALRPRLEDIVIEPGTTKGKLTGSPMSIALSADGSEPMSPGTYETSCYLFHLRNRELS